MILNMSYGASQAQLIPFTVASDTDIHINYFAVNNVKLYSGKVKGFFVVRLDNNALTDASVISVYRDVPSTEVTSGLTNAVYYNSNKSALDVYSMPNGTDFEYDSTNSVFKFRARFSTLNSNNAFLKAGNYQLVIW